MQIHGNMFNKILTSLNKISQYYYWAAFSHYHCKMHQNIFRHYVTQQSALVNNSAKVTILGAAGSVGQSVALTLKQSNLLDLLCLYDDICLDGFCEDLNLIDTNCKVVCFNERKNMMKALKDSGVVLILNPNRNGGYQPWSKANLEKTAPVLREIAKNIATACPYALIAIAADPINCTVPLFSEVFKKFGQYNPQKIFGVTTLSTVRTNKFTAEILAINPECVNVPVIGGHSEQTIVPVLSHAEPCSEFTPEEIEDITKSVKTTNKNLLKLDSSGETGKLSQAFAISRFMVSLLKARRSITNIVETAYVRYPEHPHLRYLATPLLLGPDGIVKNMGIPNLSEFEQCQLEHAASILTEDIRIGEQLGGKSDKQINDLCNLRRAGDHSSSDTSSVRSTLVVRS